MDIQPRKALLTMVLNSIPFVATSTGDAEDAPAGAIPIALFGASSGATEVTIADVAGLQAIIDDLTGRIEALEPAGE